jgi:ribosomal protein L24
MTTEHVDSWLAGESVADVRFRLNDAVRVMSGRHAGMVGAVISLLAVEPVPRYIIETSSGQDTEVFDYELQIDAD